MSPPGSSSPQSASGEVLRRCRRGEPVQSYRFTAHLQAAQRATGRLPALVAVALGHEARACGSALFCSGGRPGRGGMGAAGARPWPPAPGEDGKQSNGWTALGLQGACLLAAARAPAQPVPGRESATRLGPPPAKPRLHVLVPGCRTSPACRTGIRTRRGTGRTNRWPGGGPRRRCGGRRTALAGAEHASIATRRGRGRRARIGCGCSGAGSRDGLMRGDRRLKSKGGQSRRHQTQILPWHQGAGPVV